MTEQQRKQPTTGSGREHAKLRRRVVSDPAICGGVPCVRGTRIPVQVILDSLVEGLSPDEIIGFYPSLAPDDIRAAIAYASALTREVA